MESPSLPQHDPHPAARAERIARGAASVPVTYDRFAGVAMAAAVPEDARPAAVWLGRVAEILVELGVNAAAVDRRLSALHPEHPGHDAFLEVVRSAERGGIHAAFDLLTELVQGGDDDATERPSLDDYAALFQRIAVPPSAAWVGDDGWFARMRVAGPNPMTLRRVETSPFALPPDAVAAHLATFAANGLDVSGVDALSSAAADARLFVADYAGLAGVAGGVWGGRQKFVYAPTALFAAVGRARTLVPLAVAVAPGAAPVGPADGDAWARAKVAVTVADGNVHQAVVHLAHTHLVTEAVALGVRRTLAPEHPVARLLAPHLEGTLYINDAADTKLAAPGGGVDAVMGGPIAFSRAAAEHGARSWSFSGSRLERDLADRGLSDPEILPDHPYRDDARLVLAAIRTWIEGYLRTYYVGDGAVAADPEITAFFRWLGASDGGRLRDVPAPAGVDGLVDAVAHIVFTASAQHAAVNFPQLPVMAYAPFYPLAGYAPLDAPGDWTAMLPPLRQAHYQATLGVLLGSLHHTVLGGYPTHLFGNFVADPRIDPHLAAFHAQLAGIEHLVAQRNRARAPYTFLLPSQIPQSINI